MLEKLLAMLEVKKDDPFIYYGIAIEYKNREEFQESLTYFQQLERKFPNYVPAYYHHAQVLEALDEEDKAINVYKAGMQEASKQGDAHALSELRGALELLE